MGLVRIGEQPKEKELPRDELRPLSAAYSNVDIWLQSHVGPTYDAMKAEPSRSVTSQQVRARLAAAHVKVQ